MRYLGGDTDVPMRTIALLALALALSAPGFSQNFKGRQQTQERTIRAAYKKGRVTAREYDKLMKEQQVIREAIREAGADGVFTPKEKNRIHDKLERAERRLRRYKTNGEVY